MELTAHPHATFCFPELTTDAMDDAKAFYGGLFGWTAFDVPSAAGGYALLRLQDADVAGLHHAATARPSWLPYLAVDAADSVAARARELGATVAVAPFDVPGIGRMAMLVDPAGATVALWEARGHDGAEVVGRTGTMFWNELLVNDVAAARRFYGDLLGWLPVDARVPAGPYTIFKTGERSVAGLMAVAPEWGQVPPHWQIYFAVDDADASSARVRTLGGTVIAGPMDVPGEGRFSIVEDPRGATFAIIEPQRP